MTIVEAARAVTGGIDTHGEVHVVAALDEVGGLLGTQSFGADPEGYSALFSWLQSFGDIGKVGVEGTGSYGAGIARFLARAGVHVVEVDRQNRQARRQAGKSDPLDALEAARAAQSGRADGVAKTRDGPVEAIRVLVIAKRAARGARIKAHTQMRARLWDTYPSADRRFSVLSPGLCRHSAPASPRFGSLSWRRITAPIGGAGSKTTTAVSVERRAA